MKGNIHSIETFANVDGPGTRFAIFVQGCRLRCKFCHNPDSWTLRANQEIDSHNLLMKALRYKEYWGEDGGITVSGGEPLLQIDFLLELFKEAKANGVHTCIDTAGEPFTFEEPFFSKFRELMNYTDLLLVDIKHIDEDEHRKLTGKTGKNIIEMFRYLDRIHKPIWVRHVLVPGYTDKDDYLIKTRAFLDTLNNVKRIDVLPFHQMGKYKYEQLGIPYVLAALNPPSPERVKNAEDILHGRFKVMPEANTRIAREY